RGRLDARARIDLLLEAGSFREIGLLATHLGKLDNADSSPADGVVCGTGLIDGRPVCAAAYDFTVHGGSIGMVGERKVARLRELALRERIPMVWLIDSAGARLTADPDEAAWISSFADTGYLFREQVVMSGVVPQVAAMVGPGAAGTAYIPGLADFVPMVRGTSSIAIGGPYLVKSVVGEDVTEEALGGSKVHTEVSGVADLECADDAACIAAVREYLSYFPSRAGEKPPRRASADPADRRSEELLAVIPESTRQAYDVHKVVSLIVDDGKFFEIKPRWARNVVTGLARIDGYSVGIVANNPMQYGGVLDVNSADKAARFVNLCDAFEIPLVFLQDVPGFMVGSKVEQQGIIRHGAKMLYAVASATVPKLTVVMRKAYGAGYYVMNGRAYEPDLHVGKDRLRLAPRVQIGDELFHVVRLLVRLFRGLVGERHQVHVRDAIGLSERLVAQRARLVGDLGDEGDDRLLRLRRFGSADAEPGDAPSHCGLPGMRRISRACAGVATSRPLARAISATFA